MNESKILCVEILSIGTELLTGDRLESNAHRIQQFLTDRGIRVARCVVIGDDEAQIADELRSAASGRDEALSSRQYRALLCTGGLGPTRDDLTRRAAAAAAGVPLKLDAGSMAAIERFFRERGREPSPSNREQAYAPEGARIIPNPVGTAPGFEISLFGTPVFCLPGVPSEMERLLRDYVAPRLEALFPDRDRTLAQVVVHVAGVAESAANDRIIEFFDDPDLEVGITVHHAAIAIKLFARGEEADLRLARGKARLLEIFGDQVLSGDGEGRIWHVVGRLLMERRITLALAESCTGGLLGHLMTSVPGISSVFLEGVVAYSGEAKKRTLGVSESDILTHGQVSAEVARAMALGAAKRAGARAGIGITGIAGPDGGTPQKPVGTVHMAACLDGKIRDKVFVFSGDREMIKLRAACTALDLLRRLILEGPGGTGD